MGRNARILRRQGKPLPPLEHIPQPPGVFLPQGHLRGQRVHLHIQDAGLPLRHAAIGAHQYHAAQLAGPFQGAAGGMIMPALAIDFFGMGHNHAALTAGQVLCSLEGESAYIADGAHLAPLKGRAMGLRAVLYHLQAIFAGQGHNGVHIGRTAGVMHSYDRPGARRDPPARILCVQAEGHRVHIGKDRRNAAGRHSRYGGDKGIGRHNYLIPIA